MQSIISLDNVCYQSGKRYLLKHIDWKIEKGEHWLVLGMNGSGKTSLLSIIAGLLSPTSGNVSILGENFNKNNIFSLRKKVGLVSSSFFDKIYSKESALQIVLSGLTGSFNIDYGITETDVRYAKKLLRKMRVGDKMNQPFFTMSKGERQSVLIARAMITHPEILILDEPGTGLDVCARNHMMQMVRVLAEHNLVTVIYVTHYPEEIQGFMNKTILLKNGEIFCKGDTQNVLNSANMSSLFNERIEVEQTEEGKVIMEVYSHFNMKMDSWE